jgi:hypothetical protein
MASTMSPRTHASSQKRTKAPSPMVIHTEAWKRAMEVWPTCSSRPLQGFPLSVLYSQSHQVRRAVFIRRKLCKPRPPKLFGCHTRCHAMVQPPCASSFPAQRNPLLRLSTALMNQGSRSKANNW